MARKNKRPRKNKVHGNSSDWSKRLLKELQKEAIKQEAAFNQDKKKN